MRNSMRQSTLRSAKSRTGSSNDVRTSQAGMPTTPVINLRRSTILNQGVHMNKNKINAIKEQLRQSVAAEVPRISYVGSDNAKSAIKRAASNASDLDPMAIR